MTRLPKHDKNLLLAEYTLGLLNSQETSEVHAVLGHDATAVVAALNWENGLLELADLLPPVHPSWQVLQRIQSDLGHQPTPAPSSLYRKPATNDASPAAMNPAVHDGAAVGSKTDSNAVAAQSDQIAKTAARKPAVFRGLESARTIVRRHTEDEPPKRVEPYATLGTPVSAAAPRPPDMDSASQGQDKNVISDIQDMDATVQASDRYVDQNATHHAERMDAASQAPTPKVNSYTQTATPTTATPQAGRERGKPKKAQVQRSDGEKIRAGGSIWVWRAATLVFALIALALALIPREPPAPPVNIVKVAPTQAAILQAPGQSSTPGWVVTVDAQRNVLMQPQVRSDIPANASVQLWTRNKTLPQPRSLGLIDPNQPVAIPAALMGDIASDQIFEMTEEPTGGSPTASPSGPVLFIGRMVTFGQPIAEPAVDPAGSIGASPASP